MIIGVPKEIKNNENRVAITPAMASVLINNGHEVLIEKGAGIGSGFANEDYQKVGVTVIDNPLKLWNSSEMVMKVKEPLPSEYQYFRSDLILFTYLHLAAEPELAKSLVKSKMTAIAYETVSLGKALPLLTPMSEVAGRMAAQIGAQYLEKTHGGGGILLGGVPGVTSGKVTIIGGGVVGTNAAKIAVGLGADVTIVDLDPIRLRELDDIFGSRVNKVISNPLNIAESVSKSDLVIGAVLIPGAKAPKLVTEDMIKSMKHGSVVVDVAVDQGGIIETANKVTTHDKPTYVKHGVVHYAVANMPGAVPRTSTLALTNSTATYALELANKGLHKAILENESVRQGVNTFNGYVTCKAVAKDLGYDFVDLKDLFVNAKMDVF